MPRAWMVLLLAAAAQAEVPDSAQKLARTTAELRRSCDGGQAGKCLELGSLADSTYTVMANGYHHEQDTAQARQAYQRALQLLDGKCGGGDGKACVSIAGIYFSDAMRDRGKRLAYLEKGCAAGDAWSCFDRGQASGRSKSATVHWYTEACQLGDAGGCRDLSMVVLSSLVLDAAQGLGVKKLRKILEGAGRDGDRPQHLQERALALAVARLWVGDRRGALAELAAADAQVTDDQKRLHVFAAYAELVAADGIHKPRALKAWERLQTLVPQRDGKYGDQQLESDYAWADPTAAMKRAEAIAARNR